jgi:predicted dehydrogenase
MPFPDIDANLLGIEQAEFIDAILTGREPEVTGAVGLRALGLMMGFLESELLGRVVTMEELVTSDAMPYEATINQEITP